MSVPFRSLDRYPVHPGEEYVVRVEHAPRPMQDDRVTAAYWKEPLRASATVRVA